MATFPQDEKESERSSIDPQDIHVGKRSM
ncbi:uncharacterized protein G2W53_026709 [Senna tora]|uniref:Uncharacterized protein n=1 Tax=Senna tora TaxID=362788 RepID=A0A834WLK5_9FABA|nr:uncharacterized protein G2W53_026709 [Senna tora]